MMSREEVEQKLKMVFSDQLGIEEREIKSESTVIEDLGADSLDVVELIMAAEEEFDVTLPDVEAEAAFGENPPFEKVVDFVFEKVKEEAA